METPETTVPPKPGRKRGRWRKLGNVVDVKQALAKVIKGVYDGELSTDRGAVCVSGLRVLAQVMHDSELEQRLVKLEEQLQQSAH